MNRRRWFVGRRLAVWLWGMLALLLAAECGGSVKMLLPGTGGTPRPQPLFDAASPTGNTLAANPAENAAVRLPYTAPADAAVPSLDTAPGDAAVPSLDTAPAGVVALTFDDGPHPVYTPKLLDGLKERGVKVSFFLIGQNIDGNEDIVLRMQQEGHLIGNHSQSHMKLTAANLQSACDQIDCTNRKIAAVTGKTPAYIRPPYGSWSDELESAVPMTAALWNLDPLDWKSTSASSVVRYVEQHVENGSIILLHDIYETSVDAALEIVDRLSLKGYQFVTVDEMLID